MTATGSQRPIITRAQVEAVTGRHRRDPLFIIDIAVPRDVEASVGDIEQVFLYNVDDLQTIVQENLSRRSVGDRPRRSDRRRGGGEVRRVAAFARRGSDDRGAAASGSMPSGDPSCSRLDGKLSGLPPEARARVDEVTRLIVEKLLLEPTEQLKALPDEETQVAYTEAVNRLFRLREGEALSPVDDGAAEVTPADRRRK